MELESYMYEDKREVKVLDTGDRKGQHQRPHAVKKSRNKREGRPRSFPQLTSFPSHLCRTARASHPIAPPPSHVPPFVNCHQENWPPGRKPYMRMSRLSSLSLPLSAHEAQRGGRGENGVWRGSRKTEPPPREKKNPLSNGRIATVLRGPQRLGARPLCRPLPVWVTQRKRGPSLNLATRQETGRVAGDAVRGAPVRWIVRRKTDKHNCPRTGKGGSRVPLPPPQTPTPQTPTPTSPQCDPDTQFARSSLTRPSTGYCVWILSLPFVVLK